MICELCSKSAMYTVTINGYVVCEECTENARDKQPDGLGFRSADHSTTCTIKHGAGDPYAGRNGFEARVTFARAS